MKHIKLFDNYGGISDHRQKSEDNRLRDKLLRRIRSKSDEEMVVRLIEEVKNPDSDEGFVKGLMWSLGIGDNQHIWVEDNKIKMTK